MLSYSSCLFAEFLVLFWFKENLLDAANVKSVQQENSTFEDYLEIFSEYRSICVISSGLLGVKEQVFKRY